MPATGLRARKKQQTREGLQSAALRLTAERGLDHVTVEDIATEADVSVRTFFNYFPTKEDAVIGVQPGWLDATLALLAARPAGEQPFLSLRVVLMELSERLVQGREEHVLRRQVVADNPSLLPRHIAAFVEFERALESALHDRERLGPPSLDAALLVSCSVAGMRVAVDAWVASDGSVPLRDLLTRALDQLAAGLLSLPGQGDPTALDVPDHPLEAVAAVRKASR